MPDEANELPFEPLHTNVIIVEDAAPSKSTGGILLPDTAKKIPAKGKLVAIGADVIAMYEEGDCPVQIGSRVMYSKYGGESFRVNGQDYLLIDYKEVSMVFK